MEKEALARIKINKLLEDAGWRFFDTAEGKAKLEKQVEKAGYRVVTARGDVKKGE